MSETNGKQKAEIACDLSVFTPEEREQHFAVTNALFGAALEVRPLPDGYSVRLPGDSPMLTNAVAFIRGERRCCPFETFEIRVEPYGGAIWLSLIGPEGYREAVTTDLSRVLKPDVAAAAGLG